MVKKFLLLAASFVLLVLWAWNSSAIASTNVQATPFPTSTPLQDGRILYVVLPGDSQWLISAKFGIEIEQLRILNNWAPDEVLLEDQVILLGLAQPEEATSTPSSATGATPVGTPENEGTATICVLLYLDVNGDALRQESEFGIAGGAVSISKRSGLSSNSADTSDQVDDDGDPILSCFEDLPLGEYTISVAAPENLNPTTVQSATMELNAGDIVSMNFGAQAASSAENGSLTPVEGGRSPLLGLLGVILLLSGLGLGVYTWRLSRRR